MNWSRAKTILIILFLLSDLFLLGNIIVSTRNSKSVTPEIIESTIKILNTNNISISSNIIPKNTPSAPYAEADNVISDFEAFAKLFLGNDIQKADENLYTSDRGEILFIGDSFRYKASTATESSNTDEKNAQAIAITFLKNKGFDLSDAEINTEKSESGSRVILKNTFSDLPIFNSLLEVDILGEQAISVSGTWFNVTGTNGPDNELKSITSSLIDFIPSVSKTPTKITNITLGYTVPDSDLYHKSAVLVPVWKITEDNKTDHYPDARTTE